MSHTFKKGDFVIHHDGSYEGDAEITNKSAEKTLTVPCDVLVAFMAEYVRSRKIARIEEASDEEILGIAPSAGEPT